MEFKSRQPTKLLLSIAGISVCAEHRYPLTSWDYAEHRTNETPQFTVSVTEQELREEYDRLNGKFELEDCESNCLYRKVSLGMLPYDAFLLHAAVVAVDGVGYAFTAPSGTGKSTHAGYWLQAFGDRAVMVNGDKPIIRLLDGEFYICGTPWRGKERAGNAQIVPLKAICLLARGSKNEITPADPDTVIDRIFHQVLMPEDPELVAKQLELMDRLICDVSIYELKCNMSREAAEVAWRGMKNR